MKLKAPEVFIDTEINLPASKSISNRLLIIQALCESGEVSNLSPADDTLTLHSLLNLLPSVLNVGHAGTAFRFLTAFLSITPGTYFLTGSDRMKLRPIEPLVTALQKLGADIIYDKQEGFPPLKINGKTLIGDVVEIESSTSSQFVSALMLIAPYLKKGLTIKLKGETVSKPYINMTTSLMTDCGATVKVGSNLIQISKSTYSISTPFVEFDWSAAAFWFEFMAIAKLPHLLIHGLKQESIQGDKRTVELFKYFGVNSEFNKDGLNLSYASTELEMPEIIDFKETPDLVQPFLVTAAALNIPVKLIGVQTLKNKETNRLEALKKELSKFGADLDFDESSVWLHKGVCLNIESSIVVDTYQDHRMAMAFAPLSVLFDTIEIAQPEVVEKSYPDYWNQLKKLGFTLV